MIFWAQLTGFSTWLANPWLLVAGALAVALPVLIHLLNRRRHQVVEWAAMEFLLEADRTNRRRIRLQHFILLLLRSLSVLLIGLLLARPFVPSNLTAGLVGVSQFERFIIFDDSLSMQARGSDQSAWETARQSARDLIRELAQQRGDNSTCTLLVTSQPGQPLMSGMPLTKAGVAEVLTRIEQLKPSDSSARWPQTLQGLSDSLAAHTGLSSRVIYLFTDLRQADWQPTNQKSQDALNPGGDQPINALTSLRELSQRVQQCYLIDTATNDDGNLQVTEVRPEGPLVSGVRTALDVTVKNHGLAPTGKVAVKMTVEDGLPTLESIERIQPGEAATIRFAPTFFLPERSGQENPEASTTEPRRVRVELQASATSEDRLAGDSTAYFPAQISRGVQTLLVDGDPSNDWGQSESFYLRRALAPDGPIPSGILPHVVTEREFDDVKLDDYAVICLLNVARLGEQAAQNLGRLEQWVAGGGSLVILPGDLVDLSFFNNQLWRGGNGLSPLKLEAIRGDEQRQQWLGLRFVDSPGSLGQFVGSDNPLLNQVKIFRWWQASAESSQRISGGKNLRPTVLAELSDSAHSPAIAMRPWGDGKVVTFVIPGDAAWHDWPSHPAYVLVFQDLVHSLTGDDRLHGWLRVGEAIHQPVDLARYEKQVTLAGPEFLNATLQAAPLDAKAAADGLAVWQVSAPTDHLGFYELTLKRRDNRQDRLLYAANAPESEGNLQRVAARDTHQALLNTNIQLVTAADLNSLAGTTPRVELWWYLAWLLVVVLGTEQLLGWAFGRERS